jgi:tetratricopeptide (TPR) repeat protein
MAITFWPAAAFLAMLAYAADQQGITNPLVLVPAYLGLPSSVPPEVANAALEIVPRPDILVLVFYLPLSFTMLIGLYLRWKPIYFLLLFTSLLTFVLAGAGMALYRESGFTSGIGMILALMMFLLLLQLEDDFFFDERRTLLRVDRSAKRGLDFLVHGRRYARQKLWAMAALHLRRAVAWPPGRIDCHLELAVAYIQLKRYELAAESLSTAMCINPDDPRVAELAGLLDSLRLAANLP